MPVRRGQDKNINRVDVYQLGFYNNKTFFYFYCNDFHSREYNI